MGWLITLGILILLGLAPLGIHVTYDQDGVLAKLVAGPAKIVLFPRPKKEKKAPAPKQQPTPKPAPTPTAPRDDKVPAQPNLPPDPERKKKKKGGSVTDFLPLVKVALNFLGDFRRKLRVDVLEAKIILAGDDPCDLAVNYGRAWAALGNLLPRLERVLVIKKRDLNIECDFEGSETLITARVQITITLGRLLGLAAVYGFKGVKTLIPILNKRKGGNVK